MKKPILLTVGILLISTLAFAVKEGGGDGSINFNGKWLLADVFVDDMAQTMELSQDTKDFLNWVIQKLYYQQIDASKFKTELMGPDTVYAYVDELPCKDEIKIPGKSVENFACTNKSVTYLLKNKFDQLDFQGKALGLFHERLHNFANVDHLIILTFIDALNDYVTLSVEQAQGNYRQLTEKEKKSLKLLRRRAYELGFDVNYGELQRDANPNLFIWPNGGGRILLSSEKMNLPAMISADTVIDVDSGVYMDGMSSIIKAPMIVSSKLLAGTWATDPLIQDSTLNSSTVTETMITQSVSTNTKFYASTIDKSTANDSTVSKSQISQSTIDSKSVFESVTMSGGKVKNCTLQTTNKATTIGSGFTCENSTLKANLDAQIEVGENVTLSQFHGDMEGLSSERQNWGALTIAANSDLENFYFDRYGYIHHYVFMADHSYIWRGAIIFDSNEKLDFKDIAYCHVDGDNIVKFKSIQDTKRFCRK